jgi:hypothetical protein
VESVISEVDAVATARGFVVASFTWTINGVLLATHGTQAYAAIPGQLRIDEPQGGEQVTGSGTTITYIIDDGWNRSRLRIRNTVFIGNCELEIVAQATETAKNDAQTTADTSYPLVASLTTIEDRYYEDRRRCNPEFHELDRDLEALGHEIFIAKTLPDPPHDATLRRVLTVAERVRNQAARAADSADTRRDLLRELGRPGIVRGTTGDAWTAADRVANRSD